MNFGVVLQTDPPARRVIELAKLSESLGFRLCLDVRLAGPVARAVRDLLGDPGRDELGDRRPDGHQPALAQLGRDGFDVRHPERHVRQPDRMRHRPGRLGRAGHRG